MTGRVAPGPLSSREKPRSVMLLRRAGLSAPNQAQSSRMSPAGTPSTSATAAIPVSRSFDPSTGAREPRRKPARVVTSPTVRPRSACHRRAGLLPISLGSSPSAWTGRARMDSGLARLGLAAAYLSVVGFTSGRCVQRCKLGVMPRGPGAWGPGEGKPDRTRPLSSAHPSPEPSRSRSAR